MKNPSNNLELYCSARSLIQESQKLVVRHVNTVMVFTYYRIGQMIVEHEQSGQQRAGYAEQIIRELSDSLTQEFGKGYSASNLEYMRRFYLLFGDKIPQTLSGESLEKALSGFQQQFRLSWSHYVELIRMNDTGERSYYEIEATRNNWSVRELRRLYSSSLYERDHFHVDLVFYNRLLHCFVLIDLKIGKLTHQDIGQMQMYINYYDRRVKLAEERPTIGIILCKEENRTVVEFTLPEDNRQIFAKEYKLYLPSKEELRRQLE